MRIESSSASVPDKRLSELYLRRARNELNLSVMVMKISEDPKLQMGLFSMPYEDTYFSAVISHAYYCIFYAAKSYLLIKGVKTKPPEEHRKTYEAIERLAKEGVIDIDLLKAYRELMIRAETLLKIFEDEKEKRGRFTYRTIPQANKLPAVDSVGHARFFLSHMAALAGESG